MSITCTLGHIKSGINRLLANKLKILQISTSVRAQNSHLLTRKMREEIQLKI